MNDNTMVTSNYMLDKYNAKSIRRYEGECG